MSSIKKPSICVVDLDFQRKHNLTFMQAALFGIVYNLQCPKDGYCQPKTSYFQDTLGRQQRWIHKNILYLKEKRVLWCHIYNTPYGNRRHIVTPNSIDQYKWYLKRNKYYKILSSFKEEFIEICKLSGYGKYQVFKNRSGVKCNIIKKETSVNNHKKKDENSLEEDRTW